MAILLDIGPHMWIPPTANHEKPIESATRCLKSLLLRNLFSQSKDEVALLLCGTEATDNHLADDDGNFEHISLIRELGRLDWDLVEQASSDFSQSNTAADCKTVIGGILNISLDLLC